MGEKLTDYLSKIRDLKRGFLERDFGVPYPQAADSVIAHGGHIARLTPEEAKELAQVVGDAWMAGNEADRRLISREYNLNGRRIKQDGNRYVVYIDGMPTGLDGLLRAVKYTGLKRAMGSGTTVQDSIPQTKIPQVGPPPVTPPVKPPVLPPPPPPVKPPYQRPGMPELRLPEPIDTPVRGTMPYGAALYNSTGYFGPAGYTNVSNPKVSGVFSLDDFKKSQATSEECGGKLKKHLSGGKLKKIVL